MKNNMTIRHFLYFFCLFFIAIIKIPFASSTDIEKWPQHYDGAPIIDSTIIPGFVLYEKCKYSYLPVREHGTGWEVATTVMNKKFDKTNEVKRERELWATISQKEYLQNAKKNNTPIQSILVLRYSFGSHNDAEIFADAYKNQQGEYSDGSFSGKSLGERCWSNKSSHRALEEKATFGYISNIKIIFLKGNTVVLVDGNNGPIGKNSTPMLADFVENIARVIDNRLK